MWGFKNCILSIRIRIAVCLLSDACLRCQAENKQEDCVGMLSFCSPAFSTEGFLSVGMFEFAIKIGFINTQK